MNESLNLSYLPSDDCCFSYRKEDCHHSNYKLDQNDTTLDSSGIAPEYPDMLDATHHSDLNFYLMPINQDVNIYGRVIFSYMVDNSRVLKLAIDNL